VCREVPLLVTKAMKFLTRLATGDIALWRTFWLVGTPLAVVCDATGLGMLTGFGVGEPLVATLIIAVFTLSSVALVCVAAAIWRSAARYPREAWWKHLVAWSAKLCAVFSGLAAAVSFCLVLYLAFSYLYAGVAPV
jgi:hypothetical protein